MPNQIFLSYCRKDAAIADAFHEAAVAHNLKVWYDNLIPAGRDWRESVVEALQSSNVLLILFSAESNKSAQLIKELAIADRQRKPVIPVLIENTEPTGAYLYEMASREWINLYPNPATRVNALAEMLAAQLLPRQSAAPPAPSVASAVPPVPAAMPQNPAARAVADDARDSWFPATWYDIVLLAPILVGSSIIEATRTTPSTTPVHPAVVWLTLIVYMLVLGVRNAKLNRSVASPASFASYMIVVLLVAPFAVLPYWHGLSTTDFWSVPLGLLVISVFAAALANVLQVILRKIFQLAVFKARIGKPLPSS
jgi:hypothetical protein